MATWLRKLDIVDVYSAKESKQITVIELARVVADRLEELDDFLGFAINNEKRILINQFRNFSGNEDEFDELLDDLYDWGDNLIERGMRVCLIKIL